MKPIPYLFVALGLGLFSLNTSAQMAMKKDIPYVWKTDTSQKTIELNELHQAAQKDEIRALNFPKFVSGEAGKNQYFEHEPVIYMNFNGVAKAYPLSVLTLFELCNDTVGGEPVMVTFCPMCNAAMVFNRKVKHKGQEVILNFGVSGILMHNDMVMYDHQTESWWQQLMGEAIVGEMAGTELKMMRAMIISVKDYFDRYPDGQILAPAMKVKIGKKVHRPFHHMEHNHHQLAEEYYIPEKTDPRLPPLERVLDIHVDDHAKIYPFTNLAEKKVINESFDGMSFVIFFHDETVSVLDEDDLKKSKKTGSATAFKSHLDGVDYTFETFGNYFKDHQTGSVWDITGYCREGVNKGKQLWLLPHSNHFAFAYLAFFPECEIYGR